VIPRGATGLMREVGEDRSKSNWEVGGDTEVFSSN